MDKNKNKSFGISYDNYLFWALAVIAPVCIKIVMNSFVIQCMAAMLSRRENITDLVDLNRRFGESGLGVMSTGIASFLVILIMIWLIGFDEKSKVGGFWYGLHKISLTLSVELVFSAIILSLMTNYILNITLKELYKGYESTEKILFSGALILRILVLGLIVPICEEYIFRGIVYRRLTIQVKTTTAIIASAFLFGVYHGNLIQGIYATLMGLILGFLYEKYKNLSVPIIFHAAANIAVIMFGYFFLI